MEISALKELGLTDNEIRIYLFLLKTGNTTTGPIIKGTGISNSRVYESLNSLIKKGLTSYNTQKGGRHFRAEDPKILLEKEHERKERIESIIPQLSLIQNQEGEKTKSAVYEGFEGFKTAFKKIIDDCPVGKTISIIGFSEQQHKTESLRIFLSNQNLKSAKKKHKLKIILNHEARETLGKDRKKEKFVEVKYMPKKYISPAAIDIFQDYVYIFLWEEKPFVFMIKNGKIAVSFKQYFNFLWQLARK